MGRGFRVWADLQRRYDAATELVIVYMLELWLGGEPWLREQVLFPPNWLVRTGWNSVTGRHDPHSQYGLADPQRKTLQVCALRDTMKCTVYAGEGANNAVHLSGRMTLFLNTSLSAAAR